MGITAHITYLVSPVLADSRDIEMPNCRESVADGACLLITAISRWNQHRSFSPPDPMYDDKTEFWPAKQAPTAIASPITPRTSLEISLMIPSLSTYSSNQNPNRCHRHAGVGLQRAVAPYLGSIAFRGATKLSSGRRQGRPGISLPTRQ